MPSITIRIAMSGSSRTITDQCMGLADAPVGAIRHRRTNEKSGPRGMWLSPSGRAEV